MGTFLSANQNLKLSLKYLKQFKNLNSYFAHKSFLHSIANHISLYKIPIDPKSRSPMVSKQPSVKMGVSPTNEKNPPLLFQSLDAGTGSGSEPLTPATKGGLIIQNNIGEISFANSTWYMREAKKPRVTILPQIKCSRRIWMSPQSKIECRNTMNSLRRNADSLLLKEVTKWNY